MNTDEPNWFSVLGGPPPGEVLLRDLLAALLVLLGSLLFSLTLPATSRLPALIGSALLAITTFFALQQFWRRSQRVRVMGNLLEHHDGGRTVRVALNRAVLSAGATPSGRLVLMLDDGRGHVTVARRATPHELSDLPPCLGPYLELSPEDFETVRIAAQRSYPQA